MLDNDNIDNDNTDPVNTDDNNPNPDDTPTTDDSHIDKVSDPISAKLTDSELFPKTIESERDRAKAEELYRKGYDLYKENKYDEAIVLFLEALKYDDTYTLAYCFLGFAYDSLLDYETAVKYCYKNLEYDPLDKIIVYFLERTLRNKLERPTDADEVLENYNDTIPKHINANTKGRKELSTKVTKIESRLDATESADYVKEAKNTLKKVKDSESKIDSIETSLTKRIEELNAMLITAENGTLAEYYQKKANDLREDLRGVPKKLFYIIPYPSFGFIQKYWGMILIDIAVLLGFYSLTSMDFSTTPWKIKIPANAWEILGAFLLTSPIMILLLWGTRYFNRRIHETVHLIEEYEHKAIVLKSFASYSAQLKSLDTPEKTALLKYTEKVSHIITESPTHALTRKKTDKLPMEFVQALNQAYSKK